MENRDVPFIVYERSEAKSEWCIKRLIIALIISIVLMFATNAIWLWAWMQYDYVESTTQTEEVDIDGDYGGNANYIKNGGVINNGTDKSEDGDYTD